MCCLPTAVAVQKLPVLQAGCNQLLIKTFSLGLRVLFLQMLVHFLGRFDSPGKQEIAVKALHDLSMHPISAVSISPFPRLSPTNLCIESCRDHHISRYS